MPDNPLVIVAAVIIVGFVAIVAYGLVLERRRTPQEKALDQWVARLKLLESGYRAERSFEDVMRHYSEPSAMEFRDKLARHRVLRDGGVSTEGAAIEVLGPPPMPAQCNTN